ncbi:MAG: hypothetical protein ACJ77A_17135 [Actinomycetota bacterium]
MRRRHRVPVLLSTALVGALALQPVAAHAVRGTTAVRHTSEVGLGASAHHVKGGTLFQHKKPNAQEHDQFLKLKIPTVTLRPRNQSRVVEVQRKGPASSGAPASDRSKITIPYFVNTDHLTSSSLLDPNDPNVAAFENKVVVTNNEVISFSVDGGHTFHTFNVGSLYADRPAGGVCCDQVIRYAPSINRFIWIDQYWTASGHSDNLDRLAVFPPSSVTAGGLTSWTYWDITAAELPGTHPFLDYPDLALGSNYVYFSSDAGAACCSVNQSVIARIGLDNLQNGLNLAAGPHAWRYLDQVLLGGQVTQNTLGRAFWARNIDNSHIQVNSWSESSTSYLSPAAVVAIGSWPNTDYTTTTPDGKTWLATYTGAVIGEARGGPKNDSLWFAWTAGRGSGKLSWLSQVHVELVQISASTLGLISQRAIWNPAHTFAYPALTTNPAGQLAISMAWGGGCCYVNFAVGNLTTSPFLVINATSSTANCLCGRWGDYFGIGPANQVDRPNAFVAAGYGFSAPPAGGPATYDPHFVGYQIDP